MENGYVFQMFVLDSKSSEESFLSSHLIYLFALRHTQQCQLYCAGASRYIGVFNSETLAVMAYRVARARVKAIKGDTPDAKTKQVSLLEAIRTRYNYATCKHEELEEAVRKDYEQYIMKGSDINVALPGTSSTKKRKNNIKKDTAKRIHHHLMNGEEESTKKKRNAYQSQESSTKITTDADKVQNQPKKPKKWELLRPGDRIAIYWQDDNEYYNATIQKRRATDSPEYFLLYDDEETEWLDLKDEIFYPLKQLPVINDSSPKSAANSNAITETVATATTSKLPSKSVISFCNYYSTNQSTSNSLTPKNLWKRVNAGDTVSIYRKEKKRYVSALIAKQRGEKSSIFFVVYNSGDHDNKEEIGPSNCSWTDLRFENFKVTRQQRSNRGAKDFIPSKIRFQLSYLEKVYQVLVDAELEDPSIGHWASDGKSFYLDSKHPRMSGILSRYFHRKLFCLVYYAFVQREI